MPNQIQTQDQVLQSQKKSGSILGSLVGLLSPFMPGGQIASKAVNAIGGQQGSAATPTTSQPTVTTPGKGASTPSTTPAAPDVSKDPTQTVAAAPPQTQAQQTTDPNGADPAAAAKRAAALQVAQENPGLMSLAQQNPGSMLAMSGLFNELHSILTPMQQQGQDQMQNQQDGGISA
jgi:hypothetical protein